LLLIGYVLVYIFESDQRAFIIAVLVVSLTAERLQSEYDRETPSTNERILSA